MASYGTFTVTSNPQPILVGQPLVPNGQAVGYTIANNDETNPIWISESKSVSPSDPSAVQVAPLGSAPLDPTTTTYAVTAGPTVQAFLFSGGGTWAPSPAQVALQIATLGLAKDSTLSTNNNIANNSLNTLQSGIALPVGAAQEAGNLNLARIQLQAGIASTPLAKTTDVVTTLPNNIASTGVPLLTQPNTLIANTNTNVNGTVTLGPFNVNQIAYEGFFSTNSVASGPQYLEYALSWFDAGGTQIAGDRGFIIGGTVPTHIVYIKGPTKGDSVTVTLVSNVAMTINHALFQTSRVHARNEWRSVAFGVLGGTPIPCDPISGVLGAWATGSIASGLSVSAYLPLFNGNVRGAVATFSGTDILTITVNDNGNVGLTTSAIFEAEIAAGTDSSFEMTLPYDNCVMTVKNTGSTAVSPTISLVAEEY